MTANSQTAPLLSDRQMQDFICNGYVTVQTSLPDDFHGSICRQTDALLNAEPNPGNNLLPRIPELSKMLADPAVHGALTSILGPGYLLDDHRYCHANQPGSEPQRMHQDGGSQGDHRTRKVLLLYYPQDTPERLGPTGVLPGSQYYRDRPDGVEVLSLAGAAGTVTVTHYELWHGATANRARRPRYMMKFLLHRMQEPQQPDWAAADPDWDTECSLWHAMWRWHRGESAGDAGPARNGAAAAANSGGADLAGLGDPQVQRGMEAAYAVAAAADGTASALAAQLSDALAGDCAATVYRSVYALAALGGAAVPSLSAALEHSSAQVRGGAAQALAEMGGPTAAAAQALRRALADDDERVRTWAATALGTGSNGDAEASIMALEDILDANLPDHGYRRQIAAQAIVRLAPRVEGAAAERLTGLLAPYLESRNRYLRGLAAEALRRLRTPAATELLLDWLAVARWCPITTPDSPF